jgi:hypothetical protein
MSEIVDAIVNEHHCVLCGQSWTTSYGCRHREESATFAKLTLIIYLVEVVTSITTSYRSGNFDGKNCRSYNFHDTPYRSCNFDTVSY